jgi:hypothetical protein
MQHQKGNRKPCLQRILGVLEDRSGDDREPIASLVALVALPLEVPSLAYLWALTARATNTIWPAMFHQKFFTGIFIRKEGRQLTQFHHKDNLT